MHKYLIFLLILVGFNGFAQQKFTISGSVTDAKTGEDLMGVNIYLKSDNEKGTTSNYYGFYSLTLKEAKYILVYNFLGYQSKEIEVDLQENKKINIRLVPSDEALEQVVISTKNKKRNVKTTSMGTHRLQVKAVENLPVLLGERDIVKIIQLLPGVKPAGEGQSGFYVRGGNIDENLILLDQAPVYNASHLMGFFSVFNSDALRDAKIYKGHIPARYGSRLSSVLEVRMKEGNDQEFHGQGGIGLISSRLTLEGPIVKNKSSFVVSARRTYADLLMKALTSDPDIDNTKLYFYDLNLKANYRFNDNNRIFLSGYFGRDVFGFEEGDESAGFNWGNATGTLRFNHIFNSRLFSNTSLIFSDYNYLISVEENRNNSYFRLGAGIRDISLKNKFNYYLNDKNKINFGFDIVHHRLRPSLFETSEDIEDLDALILPDRNALESAIYMSNEQQINKKIKLYYGLRLTNFMHFGPGEFEKYDADGNVLSSKNYKSSDVVKSFFGWAPRLSMSYALNKDASVKASFAKTYQYLHLMTSSTSSNPTDVWMPSGLNIPEQVSYQGSAGYFKNFNDGLYEFSVEAYYRTMQNVVDYKTGTRITLNPKVEKYLVYGQGKAYGLEFLLRKKQGKLTGWVSYTLSRSLKQFDAINNGSWFSAKQDRIHDVSVVANYKISPRTEFSGVWVYYTGNAVTFPAGFYQIDNIEYPYYTERNGGRMPNYHRLDLSLTIHNKPEKKFRTSWNFSVYNAYGQMNPYMIYFRNEYNNNGSELKAKQVTLFKWVPSISYNFKF
jgi:hypothetical protein